MSGQRQERVGRPLSRCSGHDLIWTARHLSVPNSKPEVQDLTPRKGRALAGLLGGHTAQHCPHSWCSGPGLPAASQESLTVSVSPKVSGIICQIKCLAPILESGEGAHQFIRLCVHLLSKHFLPSPGHSFPKASLCPVGMGFQAGPPDSDLGKSSKSSGVWLGVEQLRFSSGRGPLETDSTGTQLW